MGRMKRPPEYIRLLRKQAQRRARKRLLYLEAVETQRLNQIEISTQVTDACFLESLQGNSSRVTVEDQIPIIKSEVPDNPECIFSDINAQDQQVKETVDNLSNYPSLPSRNINTYGQGTNNSVAVKTKLKKKKAISVKKRPFRLRYSRSKQTQTKPSNSITKPSNSIRKPSNFRSKPNQYPVPGPIDMDPNDLIKSKNRLNIRLAVGNERFLSNNVHATTTLGSSSSSCKSHEISNCTIHSDKMACAIDNCLGICIKTEKDGNELLSLPGSIDDLGPKSAEGMKQEKDSKSASSACGSSKWKGPVVNNYSRASRMNIQQQQSNSSSDISASYVISSCKKEIESTEPMVSDQGPSNTSGTGFSPQSSEMDSDNDYDDPKVDPDFILVESPPSSGMDSDADSDDPGVEPEYIVAEYDTKTATKDHVPYSDFGNIKNGDKNDESNRVPDLDFITVRDGDAEDITENVLNQDESVSKYLSDPDFYFFVGLMPFLKKLSADDRLRARSSIQRVIFDMLEFSKKS